MYEGGTGAESYIRENLKKESIKIPELNLKANKEDELRQTNEANAIPQ